MGRRGWISEPRELEGFSRRALAQTRAPASLIPGFGSPGLPLCWDILLSPVWKEQILWVAYFQEYFP